MDSGISYLTESRTPDDRLERRPPVVIAAASDAALGRAQEAIEAAGLRSAAVPLDGAAERLALQGAASAVWLELERDEGAALDALLDQVNRHAADGRAPAIVAAPAALVDLIAARLDAADTHLLIDAGPAERAAALAIATAWHGTGATLHDVTAEPSSARLRQLSDEVSRIASTLARLSSSGTAEPADKPAPAEGAVRPVSGDEVRAVIRARRLRARYFDGELFADPAWDMLLDLLQAEIAQYRVPVSSLCIASAVPATTALRWIKTMTDAGLFVRRADPHDGRRVFVELAPQASDALHRYFAEAGKVTVV